MPTETATFLPAEDRRRAELASDPFQALHYHFGMLLGDEDFRTEQGYHRGKTWLHNAWLHRDGVVWGFGLALDPAEAELRVEPGLALDAAGRELSLERAACLHLPSWYRDHRGDDGFEPEDAGDGAVRFDARVVACFRACLAGEVPALAEPCEGATSSTAHSRVLETVRLELVPVVAEGDAAPAAVAAYRRVRILFGLSAADPERAADQDAAAARDAVLALAPGERAPAYVRELARLAVLDAADLGPAEAGAGETPSRTPGTGDACLILGELRGIVIAPDGDGYALEGEPELDRSMCPAHIATRILAELACGPGSAVPSADGGGPRLDPASVARLDARTLRLRSDRALLDATVTPAAFAVTSLEASGWVEHPVSAATVTAAAGAADIELGLDSDVPETGWRLVARGTGATPILGADGRPLSGAVGGPPVVGDDGRDFVFVSRS